MIIPTGPVMGHGTWPHRARQLGHYIQFMKPAPTELLTNYGQIGGIWFDGYWINLTMTTTTIPSRGLTGISVNWYDPIHRLQPARPRGQQPPTSRRCPAKISRCLKGSALVIQPVLAERRYRRCRETQKR